jgi:hypothetical protein
MLEFPAAEHQLPCPDGSRCPLELAVQLRSLFEQCCHKDPQQRPAAEQVAQQLHSIYRLSRREAAAAS